MNLSWPLSRGTPLENAPNQTNQAVCCLHYHGQPCNCNLCTIIQENILRILQLVATAHMKTRPNGLNGSESRYLILIHRSNEKQCYSLALGCWVKKYILESLWHIHFLISTFWLKESLRQLLTRSAFCNIMVESWPCQLEGGWHRVAQGEYREVQ